mmetsp:Transcript_1679/g.4989  ORF Transcript_1679/g.4989 Transcript_1679/m.4989 type:complete len:230 (+) Transcript_1679:349-1038(+)
MERTCRTSTLGRVEDCGRNERTRCSAAADGTSCVSTSTAPTARHRTYANSLSILMFTTLSLLADAGSTGEYSTAPYVSTAYDAPYGQRLMLTDSWPRPSRANSLLSSTRPYIQERLTGCTGMATAVCLSTSLKMAHSSSLSSGWRAQSANTAVGSSSSKAPLRQSYSRGGGGASTLSQVTCCWLPPCPASAPARWETDGRYWDMGSSAGAWVGARSWACSVSPAVRSVG